MSSSIVSCDHSLNAISVSRRTLSRPTGCSRTTTPSRISRPRIRLRCSTSLPTRCRLPSSTPTDRSTDATPPRVDLGKHQGRFDREAHPLSVYNIRGSQEVQVLLLVRLPRVCREAGMGARRRVEGRRGRVVEGYGA